MSRRCSRRRPARYTSSSASAGARIDVAASASVIAVATAASDRALLERGQLPPPAEIARTTRAQVPTATSAAIAARTARGSTTGTAAICAPASPASIMARSALLGLVGGLRLFGLAVGLRTRIDPRIARPSLWSFGFLFPLACHRLPFLGGHRNTETICAIDELRALPGERIG